MRSIQLTIASEGAGSALPAEHVFLLATAAVDEAWARIAELGYEVLVLHATGAGGRARWRMADAGLLSAGPHRLEAAGRRRIRR